MLAGALGEIEIPIDELSLIADPTDPVRAIGYIDGKAEIAIVPGGWLVTGVYCSNTHRHGSGFVYLDETNNPVLFDMLKRSIEVQFEGRITDAVNDWHDENRIRQVA